MHQEQGADSINIALMRKTTIEISHRDIVAQNKNTALKKSHHSKPA